MARSILVVDDEKSVRDLLVDTLHLFGYSVLLAEHGEEALRVFQQQRPDLILADINMPCMNGIELMMAVRDLDAMIPIVLITGYDMSNEQVKTAAEKANGLLKKPFNLMQLKDLLDKLLGT